ncbi:VCBS repeat-containing protein, partial [Candidatus Parcubacteria bacterium]
PNTRYGVNVATIDINGDGIDEILTGQGQGGDSQIKVFDENGGLLINPFYALETSGAGVEVSASDLDGDGKDEIIAFTRDVFTLSNF